MCIGDFVQSVGVAIAGALIWWHQARVAGVRLRSCSALSWAVCCGVPVWSALACQHKPLRSMSLPTCYPTFPVLSSVQDAHTLQCSPPALPHHRTTRAGTSPTPSAPFCLPSWCCGPRAPSCGEQIYSGWLRQRGGCAWLTSRLAVGWVATHATSSSPMLHPHCCSDISDVLMERVPRGLCIKTINDDMSRVGAGARKPIGGRLGRVGPVGRRRGQHQGTPPLQSSQPCLPTAVVNSAAALPHLVRSGGWSGGGS